MELEMLKNIVSEVMKCDPKELSEATTFVEDLGADSLDVFRIVMGIEESFNIKLPSDSVSKLSTVKDAMLLIRKVKKA